VLNDQYATAFELIQSASPEQAGDYQEVLSVTQKAANTLDVDLSTPTPVATDEPAATGTPVETPTDTPTPTGQATETPAPTETPTPTPPLQGVE
jgi:serine/threonine-protein kinase